MHTQVSPTLNNYSPDRPVALAVSVDDLAPQTTYFFPAAPAGSLPPQWDGTDGFVANSFIDVPNNFTLTPGPHTLKIWMVEPTVIVQKIIIGEFLLYWSMRWTEGLTLGCLQTPGACARATSALRRASASEFST